MKINIDDLKSYSKECRLLIVEDDHKLQKSMKHLLDGMFKYIESAHNTEDGLRVFKNYRTDIVITNVLVSESSVFEMTKSMAELYPLVKFIFISVDKDLETLKQSMENGAFRHLNKPLVGESLLKALYDTVRTIEREKSFMLFECQLHDPLYDKDNLVMMFKDNIPTMVNENFLDFMNMDSLEMFLEKYKNGRTLFEVHEGFLYSNEDTSWIKTLSENENKLFNVKIFDKDNEARHFIVKLKHVAKQEDYSVVSFDDITELNLMLLFNKSKALDDEVLYSMNTIIKLMNIVKNNNARVHLVNHYKGLSIINHAQVLSVEEMQIIFQTGHTQLKVIKMMNSTILSCDITSAMILCQDIQKIDWDNQLVYFKKMTFIPSSPVERKLVRVVPGQHNVTMIYKTVTIKDSISIMDIAMNSARLSLKRMPSGIKISDTVRVSIVLALKNRQPIHINCEASIYLIDKKDTTTYVVINYVLSGTAKEQLESYLNERQKELILEFKSI